MLAFLFRRLDQVGDLPEDGGRGQSVFQSVPRRPLQRLNQFGKRLLGPRLRLRLHDVLDRLLSPCWCRGAP